MVSRSNEKVFINLTHLYSKLKVQISLVYDLVKSKDSNQMTLKLCISPRRFLEIEDVDIASLHVMVSELAVWESNQKHEGKESACIYPRRILSYEAVNVTENGILDMRGYLRSKGWDPKQLDTRTYAKKSCMPLRKTTIFMNGFGIVEFKKDINGETVGFNIWLLPNYLKLGNNEIVFLLARSNLDLEDPGYDTVDSVFLQKKGNLNVDQFCLLNEIIQDALPAEYVCIGCWRIGFKNGYIKFRGNSRYTNFRLSFDFEDGTYQYDIHDADSRIIRMLQQPKNRFLNKLIYDLAQCNSKEECEACANILVEITDKAKMLNVIL